MTQQPPDLLLTAAVWQPEILSGIAVLPKGQRREALEMAALSMFRKDFAGRILSFDTDAAVIYADLFARRRSAGRPAAIADLMIASIARAPSPRADLAALADTLVRVSYLAMHLEGHLAELDNNPLMVLPSGQGVKAVDALVVLRGT